VAIGGLAALFVAAPGHGAVLFTDDFSQPNGPNGVITNSYEAWGDNCAFDSPLWRMDGGTWFRDPSDGTGWSGRPDRVQPRTCGSAPTTGSAMLRMWTHRADFGNVRIDVDVRVNRLTRSLRGGTGWDGVKFYLRRQSLGTAATGDDAFYVVEPFRRDDDVHIQKKRRGRYHDVVDRADGTSPIRFGRWEHVVITIVNDPSGTVTIRLWRGGVKRATWRDRGRRGGPPITTPGPIGVRGDNADFNLHDLVVSSLERPRAPLAPSGLTSFQRLWAPGALAAP
jgi:hypothetical protein